MTEITRLRGLARIVLVIGIMAIVFIMYAAVDEHAVPVDKLHRDEAFGVVGAIALNILWVLGFRCSEHTLEVAFEL